MSSVHLSFMVMMILLKIAGVDVKQYAWVNLSLLVFLNSLGLFPFSIDFCICDLLSIYDRTSLGSVYNLDFSPSFPRCAAI